MFLGSWYLFHHVPSVGLGLGQILDSPITDSAGRHCGNLCRSISLEGEQLSGFAGSFLSFQMNCVRHKKRTSSWMSGREGNNFMRTFEEISDYEPKQQAFWQIFRWIDCNQSLQLPAQRIGCVSSLERITASSSWWSSKRPDALAVLRLARNFHDGTTFHYVPFPNLQLPLIHVATGRCLATHTTCLAGKFLNPPAKNSRSIGMNATAPEWNWSQDHYLPIMKKIKNIWINTSLNR